MRWRISQACSNRLRAPEAENRDELLQWMEQIAAQANRAGEIIRHVGSFVRKSSPKQVTADLNKIIRDIVELLQVDVRRGQAELRLDLAEALPPVCVDRIQIEQVLVNLVRNAVESMAENPLGDRTVLLRTEGCRPGGCASPSKTPAGGWTPPNWPNCSNRFSPRSPTAWEWAWPSAIQSLRRTAARSQRRRIPAAV